MLYYAVIGDNSDNLQNIINGLPDNSKLILNGKIYIEKRIIIKNKRGFTLCGNDAEIICKFDPSCGSEGFCGAFGFENCSDTAINNLAFDTSDNINAVGRVVSKNIENRTLDIELLKGFDMNGRQKILALDSLDCDGSPDCELAFYGNTAYEMINSNTVRLSIPERCAEKLISIQNGKIINFRFSVGGYAVLKNSLLTFKNCINTSITDVTVFSSPGYAITVFPRCENFSLLRYKVVCPENSQRAMSSNVDSIHLLGLLGNLTVKDCSFSGLGDDALNIHSTAGYITDVSDNRITVINKRFGTGLEDDWCQKGDTLTVYNSELQIIGKAVAESFDGYTVTVSGLEGELEKGAFIGNDAYKADALIENCEIRNSRARGLVLQCGRAIVRNCRFYGISLPAILISPDIEFWQELGPADSVTVENCSFEKCAFSGEMSAKAAIVSACEHGCVKYYNAPIHNEITLKNNCFDCRYNGYSLENVRKAEK